MSETFSCPTCGAPLTYKAGDGETIICPYCRNSVIVPTELHDARPEKVAHDRLDELLPQIRDLLAHNQKIEAIKLVRQNLAIGLKEAKDTVDQIEAGRRDSLADLGTGLGPAPDSGTIISLENGAPARRPYAVLIAVVIGLVIFMFGAVLIFVFMQPEPPPIIAPTATAFPTPTLVPTAQFASLVSILCEYSPQGKLISRFGSKGSLPGQIDNVESIAIDSRHLDVFDSAGGAHTMLFDRQDNLYLQDTTKVTRYALTGK